MGVIMKKLLLVALMVSSFGVQAKNCHEEVLDFYLNELPEYEYHSVSKKGYLVKAGTPFIEEYGRAVEMNYEIDTEVYMASSEYYSGYGAEVIVVNPETCAILKMENVYSE
jgi:hypothetical protein